MAGDCQITIPRGSIIHDLEISSHTTDLNSGDTIVISVGIPMASENLVMLGTPSTQGLSIQ